MGGCGAKAICMGLVSVHQRYRLADSYSVIVTRRKSMDTFSSRLKQERLRNKLTQHALAELGGVQPNAQGHYESGQRMPKADYLVATSSTLDIAYVITGRRTPETFGELSVEENSMVLALRKMPQADQNAFNHLFSVLARTYS
jgi:transcriptional regulator with XRE-family HTH domain